MAESDVTIALSGDVRIYIQKGGISPAAPYEYYGSVSLGGPSQDQGAADPVYLPSAAQRNRWNIVDTVPKAPALGATDFTALMDRYLRGVWWDLVERGCRVNIQAVIGRCQRPDDFTDWDAKLLLRSARITNFALPELNALAGDANAQLSQTGSLEFQEMQRILALSFEEQADAETLAEVVDALYHDSISCGDCGDYSGGCQKLYFLQIPNAGSPGLSGQVIRSVDDGATWAAVDIPSLGGARADKMAAVGAYLVVISNADKAHHYALFSDVDAGTPAWTEQNTGYVTGGEPNAIWSKSASLTYVAGDGGYIYLMRSPTTGVTVLTDGSLTTQDLKAIHGTGSTIVAVGASNAVLVSQNGGDTFATITGPAVGVALSAVWVLNSRIWFVGTATGRLFYTVNGGATWVEKSLDAGITAINDIKFANDTVGYMAVTVSGAGRVYRTTDTGNSWQYGRPHLGDLPAAVKVNALATCGPNEVAVGGLSAASDGLIARAR